MQTESTYPEQFGNLSLPFSHPDHLTHIKTPYLVNFKIAQLLDVTSAIHLYT